MIYLASFNNEWTTIYHRKHVLMYFHGLISDNCSFSVNKEFGCNNIEDFCEQLSDINYRQFRQFMEKYNISMGQLLSELDLDTAQQTGTIVMSYDSVKQLKSIFLQNIKFWSRNYEKGSERYNEYKQCYKKLKTIDVPNQMLELMAECTKQENESKIFDDFDDYLIYIFDN